MNHESSRHRHRRVAYQGAGERPVEPRRFDSGKGLTPRVLVEGVQAHAQGWDYDVMALGYPWCRWPRWAGRRAGEPRPGLGVVSTSPPRSVVPCGSPTTRACQALGGYDGGRMLFLGPGHRAGLGPGDRPGGDPPGTGGLPVGTDEIFSIAWASGGLTA